MANTYVSLYYHFIFSTKHRTNDITPEIEHRLWKYIGGIARQHGMTALQIGGMPDHVHALVMSPATLSVSKIAQYLKGASSKWIHETFPELINFAWQDGYGAFTVSQSNVSSVILYIQNQSLHHQTKTFQEEYLGFLQKNEIKYDERYLWD